MNSTMTREQQDNLRSSSSFCLISAVMLVTIDAIYALSQIALRIIYSEEGKAVFSQSVFYPAGVIGLAYLVPQLVPARLVNKCSFYCKKKLLAAWKKMQKTLANEATVIARALTRKSRILTSAHVLLGFFEIISL